MEMFGSGAAQARRAAAGPGPGAQRLTVTRRAGTLGAEAPALAKTPLHLS